jgi:hypothetical protein
MQRIEIIFFSTLIIFSVIALLGQYNHLKISHNFVFYFWGVLIPFGFVNKFIPKSKMGKWLNKKVF